MAAKNLLGRQQCQGATSVVPQAQWNQRGLQPRRVPFLKSLPISYLFCCIFGLGNEIAKLARPSGE